MLILGKGIFSWNKNTCHWKSIWCVYCVSYSLFFIFIYGTSPNNILLPKNALIYIELGLTSFPPFACNVPDTVAWSFVVSTCMEKK